MHTVNMMDSAHKQEQIIYYIIDYNRLYYNRALLTLVSFQTCMTDFLLWYTRERMLTLLSLLYNESE